jgi:SnoaL-like protein
MDDRRAIVDVLCEAAWIFDHKQWERMAEVFTPDSVAYGRRGLAAITANTVRYLGGCGPTQNLLGNHRVRVDDDSASVTSYVRAFHFAAGVATMARARAEQHWDFVGEYHDELVRTADGWRITSRVCTPVAGVGGLELVAVP